MDDTELLVVVGCISVMMSSSSAIAAYLLYRRKYGKDTRSGGVGANLKGDPLPNPILSKGNAPWNTSWIGNPENLSIGKDDMTIKIKRGIHGNRSGGAFRSNPWNKLPADQLTLSYEVYFPSEFQWTKGGKLPGVCFGTANGECSTGGDWRPDQGSFRIMWRENGRAIGYSYMAVKGGPKPALEAQGTAYKSITDRTERTGHDLWKKSAPGLQLIKGWNTVTMELKMNTPGKKDGTISLTVNGENRNVRDVVFRQASNVKFTNVLIQSFFGGGSNAWNSPVDTYIKYRNFRFDAG